MAPNVRDRLELFDEKAAKLLALRFFHSEMKKARATIKSERGKEVEYSYVGPDEESIDALVLTLRFFMQDNERISLRNMRAVYESQVLPRPPEAHASFLSICRDLNRFLDESTSLWITDARPLTNREILDTFVYGAYAHAKPDKRKRLKDIESTPMFVIFQLELFVVLGTFGRAIAQLKHANSAILANVNRNE